ncbi:MAG: FG-GAP-like repeat-containing protein [Planctomycetota bacterium]|nr:FG-GAP-like repeat-containing protein [Planctomycetota bacterium]
MMFIASVGCPLVHGYEPTVIINAIWVGGGGNNLYSNANNWDVKVVPINISTVSFLVTIPSGFTVNFDVTTGSGQIKTLTLGNSTLNILPGTTGLTVVSQADLDGLINSTGGDFTATGLGTIFSGTLARVWASNGGQVTIGAPSLDTSGRNSATILSSTGPGSLLDLSLLTILDPGFNAGCCAGKTVQTITATGGGTIDLSGLQTLNMPVRGGDRLDIVLPDSTSLIDLSSLVTIDGAGGQSRWVLSNGAMLTMPSLEVIEDAWFDISGGSILTGGSVLPVSYSSIGFGSKTIFNVSGPGSLLDLSLLTILDTGFNAGCCAGTTVQTITATGGGTIDLSGLQTLTMPVRGGDRLDLALSGPTPSLIDLTSLSLMNGAGKTQWNISDGCELLFGDLTLMRPTTITVTDAGSRLHTLGSLNATSASSIALNSADATLQVDGSLQLAANITLTTVDNAFVRVGGDIFNTLTGDTDESRMQLGSSIVQFGGFGTQLYEVGGKNVDLVVQILNDENFGFGQLIVGQPSQHTTMQLQDCVDNGNSGGGNPEALYLFGVAGQNGLLIHPGSTLILNDVNLYVFDDDGLGNSINGVHVNTLFPPETNILEWPPLSGGFIKLEHPATSKRWFDALTWPSGQFPDGSTDVSVSGNVLIDLPGAEAFEVCVCDGGDLFLDGGTLLTGSVNVQVESALGGSGTILGDLTSAGVVGPGLPVGELVVDGTYTQDGMGKLEVDLAQSAHDQLTVTGAASVAGGLIARIADGFSPPAGSSFNILTTPALSGSHNVLLTTGFSGNKLLFVDPGNTNGITLIVDDLQNLIGFEDPQLFGVDGLPSDAVTGKFNNDQFDDLAVTVPSLNSVFVFINKGVPAANWAGFEASVIGGFPVGQTPIALIAAQLDGDPGGSLDLAVINRDDNNVMILSNDGTGIFTPLPNTIAIDFGGEAGSITSGDFDMNGTIDLAISRESPMFTNALIYTNDGAANFTLAQVMALGDEEGISAPSSIRATPFSKGGIPQLVVTRSGSDDVKLLLNDGSGTFVLSPVAIPVGRRPSEIKPEDLDNDKDIDLVVRNELSGDVSIIINTGAGTFAPAINLPVEGVPTSIELVDVDQDGDRDLVVAVNNASTGRIVRIYRNDSSAMDTIVFTQVNDVAQGENPVLVRAGNVDGIDGKDLITINESVSINRESVKGPPANQFGVFLNTIPCPADSDGSGMVDVQDLLALLAAWGPCPASCPEDYDSSGTVDVVDLLTLLAAWGACP